MEENIELNDLLFLALDHGISSIKDTSGTLIPFVLSKNSNGEKKINRFVTEMIENGVEEARKYVENMKSDIDIYAIAWDGYIIHESKKYDAILVEAGEKHRKEGILLAQRYETKGLLKNKKSPVGNAALIDKPYSRIYQE